jgi:hypothetical protein
LTLKTPYKNNQVYFPECTLTGIVFDGNFSPLRLSVDKGQLILELTDKKSDNAIFIDVNRSIINAILNGQRKLPDIYQELIPQDFHQKIIELYNKKFYASLGFLLKAKQAVIGRRAIDRAMIGYGDTRPYAVLLTSGGSQAICKSFQFKKPDLKIIDDFPQDLLMQITGREKISYYCILDTQMGITFVNDYMKYLKLINN